MLVTAPRHIVLEKKLGQTPLQAIEAWKQAHEAYAGLSATYAGRLDPMAEGQLLILLGDECKRQDAYRGLDKEYEVEVLFDLSTDTGDVLGMPVYTGTDSAVPEDTLRSVLRAEIGSKQVPYPAYSSKTVNGKPLFLHALEGTLGSIEIPTHTETIFRIDFLGRRIMTKEDTEERIKAILAHAPRTNEPSKALGTDFRQDAIRATWEETFSRIPDRTFTVITLRITAASGSYMRTLAERIGGALETRGMALSIRRTKIGRYVRLGTIGTWLKRFA